MNTLVRQRGVVSMNYARMTREDAIKSLGRIESYETMPELVATLFDAGREWEALRLWRDMLQLNHRKDSEAAHEARERRAKERAARDAEKQTSKERKMDDLRARSKSISRVVDAACNLWNLHRSILVSNERGTHAQIRAVLSKYCYDNLNVSFPDLAFVLRGSSYKHATICEAVNRWEQVKDRTIVLQSGGEFRTAKLSELYAELARLELDSANYAAILPHAENTTKDD